LAWSKLEQGGESVEILKAEMLRHRETEFFKKLMELVER